VEADLYNGSVWAASITAMIVLAALFAYSNLIAEISRRYKGTTGGLERNQCAILISCS
jgi:hypothetical protein